MYPALETDSPNPKSGLHIQFYPGKRYNEFRSKETGKPEFDLVPMIKKCNPGDQTNIVERPVREEDKLEWPLHWAAYERQTSYRPESGTPLEDWPRLDVATVAKLKALEFHTVEQVAECSDQQCQRIGMDCYGIRSRAAAYIAAAKDTALVQKQADALAIAAQEKADLQATVQRLGARLEALESLRQDGETEKRGPGRPRKEETE
jgi:hypothetical protein